jgi:putative FmdB family regulatory protein
MYPYRCTQCGHRFEKIQSFSAEPEKVCPKCGNATLKRLLTAPALQFKGAGWYVNDYAGKSGTSEPSASSADESKPAADTAAKPAAAEGASKPATDTASKPANDTAPKPATSTASS